MLLHQPGRPNWAEMLVLKAKTPGTLILAVGVLYVGVSPGQLGLPDLMLGLGASVLRLRKWELPVS